MIAILGLDIGGANLKMAHTDGTATTMPFELWKQPTQLPEALRELAASAPAFNEIAVTMTGELCDCFETRRAGVHAILDAAEIAFPAAPLRIWRNDGYFVDAVSARRTPYEIASANWLALATFAARLAPVGVALLVDIGSTTTDIIPIVDGRPVPRGRTDMERLSCGELLYRGVRRTPIAWTMRPGLAAEVFAMMLDARLVLGKIAEDEEDRGTADGRPATKPRAHARLARMLGGDAQTCPMAKTLELARLALAHFVGELDAAMKQVVRPLPNIPGTVLIAGSGENFALEFLEEARWTPPALAISLSERLGTARSSAACAYAVAVLAGEP